MNDLWESIIGVASMLIIYGLTEWADVPNKEKLNGY